MREWNYATNCQRTGGMGDRELLAAAEFACEREVWDRCINTSERTENVIDARRSAFRCRFATRWCARAATSASTRPTCTA